MNNQKYYHRKKYKHGIYLIILIIFILHANVQLVKAAVTLIYFNAKLDGNRVQLVWETGTERNNAGFYIERSENNANVYQKIFILDTEMSSDDCESVGGTQQDDGCLADFILARGNVSLGYTYKNIFDENILSGKTYQYRLVAVDTNGHEDRTNPINPWITPTPTITKSSTNNSTSTPSITKTSTNNSTSIPSITPKKTKTKSNTISSTPLPPTATAHIVYPTATAQPTNPPASPIVEENTPTPSEAVLAIPTLGLPSVTMIFPDTATPLPEVTTTPAAGTIPNNASWFTPQRITVIGLIVAVWVILGGGFFFVLKKIE